MSSTRLCCPKLLFIDSSPGRRFPAARRRLRVLAGSAGAGGAARDDSVPAGPEAQQTDDLEGSCSDQSLASDREARSSELSSDARPTGTTGGVSNEDGHGSSDEQIDKCFKAELPSCASASVQGANPEQSGRAERSGNAGQSGRVERSDNIQPARTAALLDEGDMNLGGLTFAMPTETFRVKETTGPDWVFRVGAWFEDAGIGSFASGLLKLPMIHRARKLSSLGAEAEAYPDDPEKQLSYLSQLNKSNPQAVVDRFRERTFAVNEAAIVEYMRALMATGAIQEYLEDKAQGRKSTLPTLLADLRARATGNRLDLPPIGSTEHQPLHVVMVGGRAPTSSTNVPLKLAQDILSRIFFTLLFVLVWVVASAALRKYVSGVAGVGAGGVGAATSYAPKEYNKDLMPEKNQKTFKDVKGCEEAKAELAEIVEYLKNPAKFTRLGGKLPKGVLLTGPPGTGKTLLARAIAGEAGVPFFYRAGSEFEEMFVGVGSRRVRALFSAAKKKPPCIVFIDEIDAVGGSRKQWESHTRKTLNQLLVEMDGFEANEGIIVLAATNLPETLDPALTRPGRFDRHVHVPNPDVKGRVQILELYLKDKPLAADVDIKAVARGTAGFSGADLANLVNIAAVKAAVDGTETVASTQLEYAKDRILMGAERKSAVLSEESRQLTAYHESGHAVVALNTVAANPVHKATIVPRGSTLGFVMQLPEKDETTLSKRQLLASLDVCMGGRVAEELVFGPDSITTGATSDLQKATAMARYMVKECGMSEAVGPVYISADKLSEDYLRRIDAEVLRLLKEAYERVRALLKKHEADLHKLAKALLENETLDAAELKALMKK